MIQKMAELQNKMSDITKDLNELSFKDRQKVLGLIGELQEIVLYLLQHQIEYNISDNNILVMLRDTLNGIEQEDGVLLLDVIRYGWEPFFRQLDYVVKNGESI